MDERTEKEKGGMKMKKRKIIGLVLLCIALTTFGFLIGSTASYLEDFQREIEKYNREIERIKQNSTEPSNIDFKSFKETTEGKRLIAEQNKLIQMWIALGLFVAIPPISWFVYRAFRVFRAKKQSLILTLVLILAMVPPFVLPSQIKLDIPEKGIVSESTFTVKPLTANFSPGPDTICEYVESTNSTHVSIHKYGYWYDPYAVAMMGNRLEVDELDFAVGKRSIKFVSEFNPNNTQYIMPNYAVFWTFNAAKVIDFSSIQKFYFCFKLEGYHDWLQFGAFVWDLRGYWRPWKIWEIPVPPHNEWMEVEGLIPINGVLTYGFYFYANVPYSVVTPCSMWVDGVCFFDVGVDVLVAVDEEINDTQIKTLKTYCEQVYDRFYNTFWMRFRFHYSARWYSPDDEHDYYDLLVSAIDQTKYKHGNTTFNEHIVDVLMVVTGQDLNLVYGYSSKALNACILFYLGDDRLDNLIQHELTHQWRTGHCTNDTCVMNANPEVALVREIWCNDCHALVDSEWGRFCRWGDPFPPIYYTLTIWWGNFHGETSPYFGWYDYECNALVIVRAIPDEGYEFDYWILDGTKVSINPITVRMDNNHELRVYFKEASNPNNNNCCGSSIPRLY